ncbi:RNB domain-containing ribonuclease [Comamonas thiooxydans]|uniref:RNB domain-containing ribonuclease n=1 Tax=Comamonas thiooxydans TaxID=363952 RepID=UPI0011867782|nr:RNB domain-containing ribonuclease [Comamonas thiooxydans]
MSTPILTIDSVSTLDIDDAFSVSQEGGGYKLVVMIADPTELVPAGSKRDGYARENVATIYRRDAAVKKMLPAFVSEDQGSLVCGKKRSAMVLELTLDEQLMMTNAAVKFEPVTVTHRLIHDDIPQILASPEHELNATLTLAASLAMRKLDQRRNNGALAMYDLQQLILANEEGQFRTFKSKEEVMGYIIVQEVMVLANVALADFMLQHNIPAIYRNHVPKVSAPSSKDMADTLQGWMAQGKPALVETAKRLLASVGSASYEACVRGHYGLAVPAYLHMTSPLRRYVDLVNIRQLKMFLGSGEMPHSPEQLVELAEQVNATLLDREAARVEHFKGVVKAKAESHLATGNLLGAKEEILVQAIKLSAVDCLLHTSLEGELLRLFNVDAMTDKVVDALLVRLPTPVWTEALAQAYVSWLKAVPPRAMHALTHGEQAQRFSYKIEAVPATAGFASRCVLAHDGQEWCGEGMASRKREAEQNSAAAALAAMLGLHASSPAGVSKPVAVPAMELKDSPSGATGVLANRKGELIAMCQVLKFGAPQFTVESSGPQHNPSFSCTVAVQVGGDVVTAQATGSTKKTAEAAASQQLLAAVDQRASGSQDADTPPASAKPLVLISAHFSSSNYKGTLLELCQKHRWPAPAFVSRAIGPSHQPEFSATVEVIAKGAAKRAVGSGSTKKAAEAHACQLILEELGI